MIKRLKLFIDYLNISVRTFESTIGASDGMIRKAIVNNADIQSKWLTNIADKYPDLSIEWLVTGKGSMIKKTRINDNVILKIFQWIEQKDSKIMELSLEVQQLKLQNTNS